MEFLLGVRNILSFFSDHVPAREVASISTEILYTVESWEETPTSMGDFSLSFEPL